MPRERAASMALRVRVLVPFTVLRGEELFQPAGGREGGLHVAGELFQNQGLMDAAWVTIRVALVSATLATVLGTLGALALTRYTRFRGRILFSGMIYAPLVMPEVITGLS